MASAIFVGLLGVALLRGGRAGWALVLGLQLLFAIQAARYVLNLQPSSEFSLDFGEFDFVFGWLPLTVAAANIILLLVPPTWRWTWTPPIRAEAT
jgi:hypothetical protein